MDYGGYWEYYQVCEWIDDGDNDDPHSPGTGGRVNPPGSGTSDSNTSKAKKIFRNSNMTQENWKKIEKLLEKIIENCLGKGLYDGLVNELNGGTLAVQFGNTSSFNHTNGTLTIDMNNMESNRLFHEMWHAYQTYQETQSSFQNSLMNQEVKAWYAQYLYVSRLPEYKAGSKWHKMYNKSDLGIAIRDIELHVNAKGNLEQSENNLEIYLLNHVRPSFNQNGYPESKWGYLYDYGRSASSNFSNLNNLSINCL